VVDEMNQPTDEPLAADSNAPVDVPASGLSPAHEGETAVSPTVEKSTTGLRGNDDIASKIAGIKIYGASAEGGKIPALTNPLTDGDKVRIGALEGRVIGIPAHTNGHVAYYFPTLSAVFTGDTMFVGGCGRVFEGKAATMVASLKKLASLPDSTQVYCGHEYTEKNLRFALTLEPGNAALKKKT